MPTKQQLFDRWKSEMEFHRRNDSAAFDYRVQGSFYNTDPGPISMEFTGKKVGVIVYDKESHSLRIIPETESK